MPNTITHCLVQKLDRKYKYIKLNIFTAVLNISLKKGFEDFISSGTIFHNFKFKSSEILVLSSPYTTLNPLLRILFSYLNFYYESSKLKDSN